ncbi:(Fe-S)-binding protein [Paractinoplanes brasiliensis]|uniref:Fe-S oxidoreductase n=1 Tax=Paractinoplanes brasiliensis TaxID=52695 RepID=A0A4R6K0Z4_9ACTN|nr:(Fe-S)-binding protein [Actinoplanes brasiliensis]TDO41256.1 Fe-S oxidoreductase [Actinoplanes brasiliensis]GID27461.1 Fe-S oxidoreductase [Actinoplanes brasiliensis]
MALRLGIGLVMTAVALFVAGRRIAMLHRLGRAAQPVEPGRTTGAAARLRAELIEVLGQRKLLTWTVPGVAHMLAFWGFLVLVLTVIEGYGALLQRDFHLPLIGTQPWLGFLEDVFILATLVSVVVFAAIRMRHSPAREGRRSRFFGSHLDAAWLVLFMIFNVVWSLLLYRGAQINTGHFPFPGGAFASEAAARLLEPLGATGNDVAETAGLLLALGILLLFLVIVVHSKHLHVFTAAGNIALSRRPRALGALLPVHSVGKPVDFEDPGEDDVIGRGSITDFTWKGLLDFATCTECGRCQSQCPAWNTGKPLSPKLLVMSLRDHALTAAPYLLATDRSRVDALASAAALTPLVGAEGVVHPDVLWSCTTCGACVEQCPVDIEHVDHVVDMRRYQVLMESSFPPEAGVLLRNLEHAGDPWGRGSGARTEWTAGLDFEVRTLNGDRIPDDLEYLFWVGCAGAFDDRAQRTSRAVAQLLHTAGVRFAVLGSGETCTGDPARRIGHELLFQQLAAQNVETLNGAGVRRIVATCAHCFNTLANEYPQLGGDYEVLHHTQLLARLVADGRLTPVTPVDATVTYHDPCYLGRHNRVFVPPRAILGDLPGVRLMEPEHTRERSFCCGAGGARMWLDETLGTRINETRTDELLATRPDIVAAACPYCVDMLADGVALRQEQDRDGGQVAVIDVAEVLLRSVSDPLLTNEPGRAQP